MAVAREKFIEYIQSLSEEKLNTVVARFMVLEGINDGADLNEERQHFSSAMSFNEFKEKMFTPMINTKVLRFNREDANERESLSRF